MKTVNLVQGTPEWHTHRAQHLNASDAPAMMGCSPYKTRAQLIREVATGITPEIDAATQRRFDDGHRFEELARPLAESIIGEDLYPCTGVLEGTRYSASFDGLTLMGEVAFEHKSLNDDLRRVLVEGADGSDLPLHYQVQMEQQCMVSGAERVLFMATKWDGDDLDDDRDCWYTPNPELRAQIVAGWEQFEKDVAAYVPEAAEAPAAAGRAPDALPVLSVVARGMVEHSNHLEFRERALAAIAEVNRDLQTDDDFATAELTVKAFKSGEEMLEATRQQILGQMADVNAVMQTIDDVSAELRRTRLELDKRVRAEKENRKAEIVTAAREAYRQHEDELRAETKDVWIALPPPDFAGAIKGKRTLSSMRDAVDTVLANAKIAANESAKHIRAALACLTEETGEHKHLFPDYRDFIGKPVEDIRALVRGRIAEHKQRESEKLEIERQRIRQEEADRVERERASAEAAAQKEAQSHGVSSSSPQHQQAIESTAVPVENTPKVADLSTTSRGARIKLGDINAAIAPLSITAAGLSELGFDPVGTERAAKLYAAADFPHICGALARLVAEAPARLELPEAA